MKKTDLVRFSPFSTLSGKSRQGSTVPGLSSTFCLFSTALTAGLLLAGCSVDDSNVVGSEESSASNDDAALFTDGGDDELDLAVGLARDYLRPRLADLGIDSLEALKVRRTEVDELSMAHVRLQQTFAGIPVFGGEGIVHFRADGSFFSFTDNFVQDVWVGSARPTFGEARAIELATGYYGCSSCLTEQPVADLQVLRLNGEDFLSWRVQMRRIDGTHDTAMPVVFVDAHSGDLLWQYDNLQTGSVTGSGTSTYYGTLSLADYQSGSTFYLEDVVHKLGTVNYNNTTTSLYRTTDTDNVYNATTQKAMVDAHYGASKYYDYLLSAHGRNGIDGSGGPAYVTSIDGVTGLITSAVHYSTKYNNAFWDGQKMTYGDGDGTNFTALTTLDICGHEMTHGVTERTAGLVYSGESGALNESISDVFGALLERSVLGDNTNTWHIGEAAFTPSNGTSDALRYMDNPHLASNGGFTADDDPDHYSERYTGTSDNGGVHINSGIANYAFYLLAKGGTHHLGGTMTGIGADDAGKIWYKALTSYMTSSTNFAGARTATLDAASALFGATSTQYAAVGTAWGLVGVGSAPGGGGGGGSELLSNGGFETSVSPWVQSGTGAFYVANGNYPQAGTGYIYLGNANNVSGTTYQQVTIPSGTSPSFSFYLNTSSAETTTTTQYDKLFVEVRNTAGTLLSTLATYSNLNKTSTAGSYSQKSFSLASFAGQTIRLQFRSTTDSSAITTFRIDSASVK